MTARIVSQRIRRDHGEVAGCLSHVCRAGRGGTQCFISIAENGSAPELFHWAVVVGTLPKDVAAGPVADLRRAPAYSSDNGENFQWSLVTRNMPEFVAYLTSESGAGSFLILEQARR
jgi:hypothetical protein